MAKRKVSYFSRRPLPLPLVILIDVLITGLALLVFAYFHHVRRSEYTDLGMVSTRATASVQVTATPEAPLVTAESTALPEDAEETPEPAFTPEPTAVPMPEPEPAQGDFSRRFADKFIDGDPIETITDDEMTYVSHNLNIRVTEGRVNEGDYLVVDFYVRDISNIRTAFAEDKFGQGIHEWTQSFAKRYGAIVTMNGDYCGARVNGAVIRNGTLYREKHSNLDVCVLYWDGTMKTFPPATSDARKAMKDGAYQAWSFGPRLLDDNGEVLKKFNSNVNGRNPRSALGYFEPGHYCFVVVNGRKKASRGVTMTELAHLMKDLGCKVAYNMDGGQSSVLTWRTDVINDPADGGRKVTDVIMLID